MRKNYLPILALAMVVILVSSSSFLLCAVPAGAHEFGNLTNGHLINDYQKIMSVVVSPDWQGSGQLFTMLQHNLFTPLFAAVLVGMVLLFTVHYISIGAKGFSHEGEKVFYYTLFCRLIHAMAAISFSVLTVSGLMIIFGKLFHGGTLIQSARFLHAPAAVVFLPAVFVLFLLWAKEMLPASGDLEWLLVFGGYLTKKKIVVPAGKFNPGQKSWFWLAVGGGVVMAVTGYYLFSFATNVPGIRLAAIIHNFLGVILLAMFMIHLYMAIFAIKGSLRSMWNGYKSAEEVAAMHSNYYKKIT